jgi:hypothetical protein
MPTASVFKRLRRFRCALVVAAAAALGGCGGGPARPIRPEAELDLLRAEELELMQGAAQANLNDVIDRLSREWDAYQGGQRDVRHRLDILAISGGGDFGAFAAGVLSGWGQVADPAMKRPEFDAVSGVSTGALIAPFAFIGTDEAYATVEEFYRNPRADWVRERGLLFFLPENPSFMTVPGLERDIRSIVTPEFIGAIAKGRREGRLLAISATNLDLSSQRVFEVGTEAVHAEATGDPDRITRIMLASAAIPIVFPPVEIDHFLYADGGVTANVFLKLDPDSPGSILQSWRRRFPDRPLPIVRYWIIVNNWVRPPAKTIVPRWPGIVGPSLATSIRSATLAEIRWLTAQARFVNAAYKADIEVRMISIPDDWRAPVPGDFAKESMNSLADTGRRLGANPASWKLLASPANSVPADPAPVEP